MAQQFYKIVDKNGNEMPGHYSGRNRTYEEAKKMVDKLNKNGEHRPYTMTGTQQTAVEWLRKEWLKRDMDTSIKDLFEQAKAMEKEQIVKSWHNGYENQSPMIDEDNCGQTYYNETYGK